ncbi:MAG TPA: hypothetical protein VIF12_02895 [Micavibrio sp.]|jgi:hypothetical protein
MFGNTKPMNEINRDLRLAKIFNAFADGKTDQAKKLLVSFAYVHRDDMYVIKPMLAVLDHIAFRETGPEAAHFASALAQTLPENLLRTEIETKAEELAKKPGTRVGRETRKTMTPDEFVAQLGHTPFEPG